LHYQGAPPIADLAKPYIIERCKRRFDESPYSDKALANIFSEASGQSGADQSSQGIFGLLSNLESVAYQNRAWQRMLSPRGITFPLLIYSTGNHRRAKSRLFRSFRARGPISRLTTCESVTAHSPLRPATRLTNIRLRPAFQEVSASRLATPYRRTAQ
jgi:hypothetical protein